MNDPKPYTLEDLDKELSPYGGARGDALAHYMGDLDPSRVLATVEALERLRVAADAMEAELEAARTYLRERCFLDPPCDLCRCKAQVLKRMDEMRRPR